MDSSNTNKLKDFIVNWKPQSEVFALKYFVPYTFTANALFGAFVNKRLRKAVKLKSEGYLSSTLPTVVLPGIFGSFTHFRFVLTPALTQQENCYVCLELRAALVAFLTGVLYPILIAPISTFVCAERYYTYPLPPITQQPIACLKEALSIYRRFLPKLYIFAALQVIGGMILVHFEMDNINTVIARLEVEETSNETKLRTT